MLLKKILWQIFLILFLSCIIGAGVNFSLLKKYFKGEFAQSFITSSEYPHISIISLAEAEDLFSTKKALFIDSRDEAAYLSGHILGALNIPYEGKKAEPMLKAQGLSLQRTLVIYCDGSECQSSLYLAKLLHENGFKDIRVFFGGWQEWLGVGLPVKNEDNAQ